jgi:uncharacterized coiled-coil protein SlyX
MSKWNEDDVGDYPARPATSRPAGLPHHVLCPALVNEACQCEAKVLKRIVGRKLVEQVVRVLKTAVASERVSDAVMKTAIKLAEAQNRIHDLEWKLAEKTKDFQTRDQQLTEARQETRRVEEKLAFTQRALDLHTQTCEKKMCICKPGQEPLFICYVHGKRGRS